MEENKTLNRLIPELYCTDIDTSIKFYVEVLDFTIMYSRPENNFAMLDKQESQIMLEQVDYESDRCWLTDVLEKPFGRGVNFQIEVDDVDKLYENAKSSNAKIFLPIEEKWYRMESSEGGNRQFVVQDPDGYLLRFFEDLGTR